MIKVLNIVTVTKSLDESVTGAVENVCLWMTRNTFAAYKDCRIVTMPERNGGACKKAMRNIRFMLKLFFRLLKNEDLLFIYPTLPLYPGTSDKKYRLAMAYYRILRAVKGKSGIFTYILDLPKEQEESFGLHRIKIDKEKLLKFEDRLFSMSDKVIAASSGFKELLVMRGCSYADNIAVVPVALKVDAKSQKKEDITRIFYSGELTRDFEKNMIKNTAKALTDAKLVICGRCGEWITEEKLPNAEYMGYVDTKTHDDIAKSCDFAIICYPNNGYYKYVTPSKLCTYIGLELPILSIKTDTIYGLLKEYKVGECVEAEAFVACVSKWCTDKTFLEYKNSYKELDFYENNIEKLRRVLSLSE